MTERHSSAAVWMILVCFLPLLVFLLLGSFGVIISPFVVLLLVIICCLVMSHLMAGSGERDVCDEHEPTAEPEAALQIPDEVSMEDVFRTTATESIGGTLVANGQLMEDADSAYAELRERFRGTGVTPLLQEDERKRPQLVLLPVDLAAAAKETRSSWLNLFLFVATIGTTTWAGALHQGVNLLQEPGRITVGLPYSLTLLLILGAHELGHYFAAKAHNMNVTLPFFIPIPFALGTFGAFIQMKSPAHTRRALFDVGVAGPLAGLVFALPALWFGLRLSEVMPGGGEHQPIGLHHGASVGSSILLATMAKASLGEAIMQGHVVMFHPLAFAGWLGLLVTALNLLPIGQLDGGHIADAMFGQRRSASISAMAMFALFMGGLFVWSGLLFWAFIAFFIAGAKGMPPLNNISKLDPIRSAIGWFSFALLFLILVPVPHAFYQSLGIHCPYL